MPARRAHRPLAAALLAAAVGCAGVQRRAGPSPSGRALAASAKERLGAPYRFGGTSREQGFDCSGLAWKVHAENGIRIPRVSFRQFRGGKRISRRALSPGDLLFFTTYKAGASHVGVYLGEGKFVHAPGTGKKVRISDMSAPYWKKRYLGARRYH